MFLKTEIFYVTSEHDVIFLFHSLQDILWSQFRLSTQVLYMISSEIKTIDLIFLKLAT